jgi:hypothetical protein
VDNYVPGMCVCGVRAHVSVCMHACSMQLGISGSVSRCQ